jgi:predicted pyridoxine 5'-phosphate oxidase superfamily flavin-nucleotide-binding protein
MKFYNDHSRALQKQFDSLRLADQLERTRKHTRLTCEDRAIVEGAAFFFLATADAQGRPDCSIKGGNPGFVSCPEDGFITFGNYDGNGMFRSLGNIRSNPWVGLLFVTFDDDPKKLRINGRASFEHANATKPTEITVTVAIENIFPNCPRYLPDLRTAGQSVYNPAPGHSPPDPFWKSKPDLEPFLPRIETRE